MSAANTVPGWAWGLIWFIAVMGLLILSLIIVARFGGRNKKEKKK